MGMALPGDLKLEITAYATADQKDNKFTDNAFTKEVVAAFELRGPFGIKNSSVFSGATGLFTRIENALDNEKTRPERILQEQAQIKANMLSLERELEEPFPHEQAYEAARARMTEIEKALAEAVNEDLEVGKEHLPEENEENTDDERPEFQFVGRNDEQGGNDERGLVEHDRKSDSGSSDLMGDGHGRTKHWTPYPGKRIPRKSEIVELS